MVRRKLQMVVLVGLVATASLGFTGSALAGGCAAILSPSTGYRGATVTVNASGFGAGTSYFFNFTSNQDGTALPQRTGTMNASGATSFSFTIPGDFPLGTANWLLSDGTCDAQGGAYTIGQPPPPPTTTTAPPPPTTAPPATTTTTAASSTTTTAPETTTTSLDDTTTTVDDTTTTTEAEESSGGIPSWALIAALVLLAVIAGAVIYMAMQRRSGGTPPPAA